MSVSETKVPRPTKSSHIEPLHKHRKPMVLEGWLYGVIRTEISRSLSSSKKRRSSALIVPIAFKATGMKMCFWLIVEYLESFLVAAASAAPPGVDDVNEIEDDAKVSTTEAFQVKHHPPCQGTNVRPSGSLPSPLRRPVSSLVSEMLARLRDRHSRSFILWWRVDRPLLFLHERPCISLVPTSALHGQVLGS